MRTDSHGFTPLEAAVLEKLVAGNHPILEGLRKQLLSASARDREMTGAGFYLDISMTTEAPPVRAPRFRINDVAADLENAPLGAVFNVLIKDGFLSLLEGAAIDDSWPDDPGSFRVMYFGGDQRTETFAKLDSLASEA
jgi:hypothetical protein